MSSYHPSRSWIVPILVALLTLALACQSSPGDAGEHSPDGQDRASQARDAWPDGTPNRLPQIKATLWPVAQGSNGFRRGQDSIEFRLQSRRSDGEDIAVLSDSDVIHLVRQWIESHFGPAVYPVSFSYEVERSKPGDFRVKAYEEYRGVRVKGLVSFVMVHNGVVDSADLRLRRLEAVPGSALGVISADEAFKSWMAFGASRGLTLSRSAASNSWKPYIAFVQSLTDLRKRRAEESREVWYYSPHWIAMLGDPLRIDARDGKVWIDD